MTLTQRQRFNATFTALLRSALVVDTAPLDDALDAIIKASNVGREQLDAVAESIRVVSVRELEDLRVRIVEGLATTRNLTGGQADD